MKLAPVLLQTDIPGFSVHRGKVRDILDLVDRFLIIATDRISAFDCILPTGIPGKGKVLTAMSVSWFELVSDIVPSHLITANFDEIAERYLAHLDLGPAAFRGQLEGRSMLVRKANRIDVECVVRGYIDGSGWKEYLEKGTACGIRLPEGLIRCQRLPENIFTPTTKADSGHDMPLTMDELREKIGDSLAWEIRDLSLAVYEKARAYAEIWGIIIADTKFEFGLLPDGTVILIDEILTPDSSRFWPKSLYKPGGPQPSFDKQFVRDWLETTGWNKEQETAPELPADIVAKTAEKYQEAFRLLFSKA